MEQKLETADQMRETQRKSMQDEVKMRARQDQDRTRQFQRLIAFQNNPNKPKDELDFVDRTPKCTGPEGSVMLEKIQEVKRSQVFPP